MTSINNINQARKLVEILCTRRISACLNKSKIFMRYERIWAMQSATNSIYQKQQWRIKKKNTGKAYKVRVADEGWSVSNSIVRNFGHYECVYFEANIIASNTIHHMLLSIYVRKMFIQPFYSAFLVPANCSPESILSQTQLFTSNNNNSSSSISMSCECV